jgi:hypothetical protein
VGYLPGNNERLIRENVDLTWQNTRDDKNVVPIVRTLCYRAVNSYQKQYLH